MRRWVTNSVERVSARTLATYDLRGLFYQESTFAEEYPRFTKLMGKNLDKFMGTHFAAFMATAGIILSALGIAYTTSPIDKDLNTMFLLSSILDLVAAAAEWAVSYGVTELGILAFSQIASFAGPLAIVAAVVGVILLIVQLATTKKPPNPIDEFVEGEAVKSDCVVAKNIFCALLDQNIMLGTTIL